MYRPPKPCPCKACEITCQPHNLSHCTVGCSAAMWIGHRKSPLSSLYSFPLKSSHQPLEFACLCSSSRQLNGLASETGRVHRRNPGGSRRAPVPHGDLPVHPGGRGSSERQVEQRPHGACRAGQHCGGRQVQVDAHVHRQPVAGGAPAAHAVPAHQRRRLSSNLAL